MTENTELKRLARRVIDIEALDGGEPIGEAWGEFEAAATPAAVLALIAENERLQHREQDLSASVKYWFNACGGKQFEAGVKHADEAASKYIDEHWRQQRDRLRAEIAGLKTGYEAYERVNAELKAECARSTEREILQLAEIEALRKALVGILDLYDTDEGCRSLPQYINGRAALGQGEQS
ncbi:hypothetical protein [Pseudomonas sp.]|uniref:hypothetical protein n=1 Tax=Pseudomonas sp. TaxID=306 RepID=UPI00258DF05F|nr:hypothetical protein [Pseudomonas sp.]